jgi:hypothetical protein
VTLGCSGGDSHGPLPPGSLRVSVSATGPLTPGPRYFHVPANCAVSDSNPQRITVPLDSIVLTFAMTCS